MKQYFSFLSVILFLSLGCCLAFIGKIARINATAPSQWKAISYPSAYGNGQTFHYLEYIPPGYMDAGDTLQYPVIISLTGLGWHTDGTEFFPDRLKGANLERTIGGGRDYPFIILTPHQPTEVKGRYNYTGKYEDGVYIKEDSMVWDARLIDEILEKAEKELRIDKNRVYLIGCSMGGAGVWQYLSAYGDKVAAAVSISGYYTRYGPYSNNPHMAPEEMKTEPVRFGCLKDVRETPIWAFHAADDDFIDPVFTYKAIEAINQCKPVPDPKAKLTIFKEGGHLRIYQRVFDYFPNSSYEVSQDPAFTGNNAITPYLPDERLKNDIFGWLLSHNLQQKDQKSRPGITIDSTQQKAHRD